MEYTRRYLMDGLHNLRDLGGYAAVASILILKAPSYVVRVGRVARPYAIRKFSIRDRRP